MAGKVFTAGITPQNSNKERFVFVQLFLSEKVEKTVPTQTNHIYILFSFECIYFYSHFFMEFFNVRTIFFKLKFLM